MLWRFRWLAAEQHGCSRAHDFNIGNVGAATLGEIGSAGPTAVADGCLRAPKTRPLRFAVLTCSYCSYLSEGIRSPGSRIPKYRPRVADRQCKGRG